MSGKGGKDSKADTSTMYVELSKLQGTGDYEKAVRVCNKILNVCPKVSPKPKGLYGSSV